MKPKTVKLYRVIRDVRDARRDKWLPLNEIKRLEAANKLAQVNVYNNQWDWLLVRGDKRI